MNNILLRTIEYLFYCMILLYMVGKSFEILTILIDITFIIYLFKNKNIVLDIYYKYKELVNAFILLLIYFAIQSLFTNDIILSIKHSVGMLRFIILLFAIIYVFDTKTKIKNVMMIVLISIFMVNFDSLYQYIFGIDLFGKPLYDGTRLTAWDNRPIVSLYSSIYFGFVLALCFIFKNEKKYFIISLLSLIFLLLIIILSGNRTPILALFTSMIVIFAFSSYKKYLVYILTGILLLFSLSFFNNDLSSRYQAIIKPNIENTSGRYQIYSTAFAMIQNNPISGLGGGSFRSEFNKYFDDSESKDNKYTTIYKKSAPNHPHSVILDILISWGIIGIVILMYLLFVIYKVFIKNKDLALLSSISVLYCISPFQFAKSFSQSNWQFYTFLAIILVVLISKYEDFIIENKKES